MTREILFLCGISGAGKSTFSASLIQSNPEWVRVNYDSIRTMLLPGVYPGLAYYERKDLFKIEQLVTNTAQEIAVHAINYNKKVIIDNTNLKASYIEEWIDELRPDIFNFKLFDITSWLAKDRIINRELYHLNHKLTDAYIDYKEVQYIDKQFKQYEQIKQWLLDKYPEKIIT